jgi:RimJ/RimL family protein N-acetyltransferase
MYACLQNNSFVLEEYEIVPLRHEDIQMIRKWRNEQMAILRQTEALTEERQEWYYQAVLLPSFSTKTPQQILFSYLLQGHLIGYGGIVHVDWHSRRGEVSFLLETSRTNAVKTHCRDFSIFLKLLKRVAFEELNLHRLYTECYAIRPYHIQVLEMEGFAFEGRMKEHVLIDGVFVDSLIHGCVFCGF